MASIGGRRSGRNSIGGWRTRTVSVLLLRTIGTNGMRFRFASLSNQPLEIACLATMTLVFEVSYTLTSLSLNTVMYPTSANLAVLMSKLVGMLGPMWTSCAGWRMLWWRRQMLLAGVFVPLGSWKILDKRLLMGM